MKNIIFISLITFLIISCTKDQFIEIQDRQEVSIDYGILTVVTISPRSNDANQDTNNNQDSDDTLTSSCGTAHLSNVRVGLFHGNTADASIFVDEADFKANTIEGNAHFTNLEPGNYTVVAENGFDQKKTLKNIIIGSNRVIIEF